jgi:hypothetical protein
MRFGDEPDEVFQKSLVLTPRQTVLVGQSRSKMLERDGAGFAVVGGFGHRCHPQFPLR